LEVEKKNSKKSKISQIMARLDELCMRQTTVDEGENDGKGG
jgi:hypothetical protein